MNYFLYYFDDEPNVQIAEKHNIRQQYSNAMAKHGFGHAVPIPVSSKKMRIGQCGYFDDTETWNPIVQITDSKTVAAKGFVAMDPTALKELSIDRDEAEWGPITSNAVTASDPKLDIGAAIPGVPVEASIEFEVDNESSFGAVLTTEKPVTREAYTRVEKPWKDWIKQNSKTIMSKYGSEVGKYKLWIITQVWMTKTARINILESSKRKVSIGFKADVAQVGKLQPHGGWSTDGKNEGWEEYSSTVRFQELEAATCVELEANMALGTQEGEQRIVFVTGFYFGFNVFTRLPRATGPGARSQDPSKDTIGMPPKDMPHENTPPKDTPPEHAPPRIVPMIDSEKRAGDNASTPSVSNTPTPSVSKKAQKRSKKAQRSQRSACVPLITGKVERFEVSLDGMQAIDVDFTVIGEMLKDGEGKEQKRNGSKE
ncbi:hypothetical protein E8E11_006608 [Didymella keratinophila]|nr:hypothetical protein E8E11_006608 [Didymella keratinophila]